MEKEIQDTLVPVRDNQLVYRTEFENIYDIISFHKKRAMKAVHNESLLMPLILCQPNWHKLAIIQLCHSKRHKLTAIQYVSNNGCSVQGTAAGWQRPPAQPRGILQLPEWRRKENESEDISKEVCE